MMMEATDRQTGRSADEPTREKDRGSGITLDECETLEQVLACMRVLSSSPHVKLSRKFATESRQHGRCRLQGKMLQHSCDTPRRPAGQFHAGDSEQHVERRIISS